MILRQFFNEALAQYSYLAGCPASGEAIIIDPTRDVEMYLEEASREGLRITHVAETHIHADYLSGSRELAERTGAHFFAPGQGGPDWSYSFDVSGGMTLVQDGDWISVGGFRLQVMHTPGHTPEHVSYVLYETEGVPMGAFTGDFVFVGDVGRPDLLEKAAGIADTMEKGARQLYATVRRFADLPDHLVIFPGHGAGSACGKALGAVPVSTLGYEKVTSWAFKAASEAEFVDEVLAGQPEPPKYFAMMKTLNKVGPDVLGSPVTVARSQRVEDLEKALDSGAVVLDIRPSASYLEGHLRGVLHIPVFKGLVNWAGWLIGYDQDVVLIASSEADALEAARSMALIGLDRVKTWFGPEVVKAVGDKRGLVTVESVPGEAWVGEGTLLDVRGRNERLDGYVEGSGHIPLGEILSRRDELPGGRVYVHCAGGTRSPIACSVLERAGLSDVVDIRDGYSGLVKRQVKQSV